MKRKLLLIIPVLLVAIGSVIYFNINNTVEFSIDELRSQHQSFLDNSPFKETINLSKKDRKAMGLPPNGYYEQLWQMSMSPKTGRPMPERVSELQANLRYERSVARGVGGDASNPWVDRGPNNQGGRTRGIMFDPNDANFDRVFAGGVSGGLWVNNDITDANSSWTQVSGLAANIAVTVIISDPNNSNTFYIGAGESYTSGDAIGNGIWKSTDGGVTWANVLGGYTGTSNLGGGGYDQIVNGIFYINDLVARDIGATTELYASVAGAVFGDGSNASQGQFHALNDQGLYKSTNNGTSWTKFAINESNGSPSNPNDIELDINNNIWFTTTRSSWGFDGGKIFRSTDGISFTLMTTISGTNRTEIETSNISANTLWVLTNTGGQADFYTTTDAFATAPTQIMTEPADADTGIPNTDFTRDQAFYDLEIEADANDNLIVGGVDLFRSTDNGATWSQISKWSNNNNLAALGVSLVHADQQAIVFRPGAGNTNKLVFGTDGGVFYCTDITMAASSTTAISARNKDYNTVQVYYGSIDDIDGGDGDDIAGGTQDNGTQFTIDASAGANNFFDPRTGDGGFTEIDATTGYAVTTYPTNDSRYNSYPSLPFLGGYAITSGTGGSFINQAGLDKNLDILYSNSSTSVPVYQIERNATFTGGSGGITRTQLTNALLDARPTAFKVSPFTAGSTKLFVGLLNGKLLRLDTADGVPTWNDITGASFVGSISDIEFGQNESEIFVTMHNYDVTSIWFTSNGGTTWASKEGNLADMPVKCILQNPLVPAEVIIGTQIGVWSTTDYTVASPVWVQSNNGMSDVAVLDLDVRPSDNVILASTFGRGMFTSQFTAPLSIADNNLIKKGISIFPTINDGNFTIVAKSSLGDVSMRIFSITGQEVLNTKFQLSTTQHKFNLKVTSGIYFVTIKGDNFGGTQKIIVK